MQHFEKVRVRQNDEESRSLPYQEFNTGFYDGMDIEVIYHLDAVNAEKFMKALNVDKTTAI